MDARHSQRGFNKGSVVIGSIVRRCELTAGRAVARPSLSCHRTCRQLILYTKTTSPKRCRHHAREAARVRPRTTKTTTSGERTRTLSRRRRRSASYLPFPRAVKRRCASRRTRRYAVLGEGQPLSSLYSQRPSSPAA